MVSCPDHTCFGWCRQDGNVSQHADSDYSNRAVSSETLVCAVLASSPTHVSLRLVMGTAAYCVNEGCGYSCQGHKVLAEEQDATVLTGTALSESVI